MHPTSLALHKPKRARTNNGPTTATITTEATYSFYGSSSPPSSSLADVHQSNLGKYFLDEDDDEGLARAWARAHSRDSLSVLLDARAQLLAVALGSHPRCGALSPLFALQARAGTLPLRYLWELCCGAGVWFRQICCHSGRDYGLKATCRCPGGECTVLSICISPWLMGVLRCRVLCKKLKNDKGELQLWIDPTHYMVKKQAITLPISDRQGNPNASASTDATSAGALAVSATTSASTEKRRVANTRKTRFVAIVDVPTEEEKVVALPFHFSICQIIHGRWWVRRTNASVLIVDLCDKSLNCAVVCRHPILSDEPHHGIIFSKYIPNRAVLVDYVSRHPRGSAWRFVEVNVPLSYHNGALAVINTTVWNSSLYDQEPYAIFFKGKQTGDSIFIVNTFSGRESLWHKIQHGHPESESEADKQNKKLVGKSRVSQLNDTLFCVYAPLTNHPNTPLLQIWDCNTTGAQQPLRVIDNISGCVYAKGDQGFIIQIYGCVMDQPGSLTVTEAATGQIVLRYVGVWWSQEMWSEHR
ncbi:hypothetical protein Pelo_13344 [Pelomyxa schiedti]|nr:hypothetical protein Pelo_13344 [Pelomyxa schiedti]